VTTRPRNPKVALPETAPAGTARPARDLPERPATSAVRDPKAEGKAFVHSPTFEIPSVPPGTVATALPPRRRSGRAVYDWDKVRAMLEDNPGLWVMALTGLSSGMYSYVRNGGPEAFVGMGGHMQVSLRNRRPNPNAKGSIGDLWLRWIPAGWTAEDQARAEAAHAAGEGVL